VKTPNPAPNSSLRGISCSSARACTAVGNSASSGGSGVPLAERWGGTRWKIQGTPTPSDSLGGYLSGVSCAAALACTAAGSYNNKHGKQTTLAEDWEGVSWSIQPPAKHSQGSR
jgi:hypothetical protein